MLTVVVGIALLIPVTASAALEHPFIEDFGSTEQPSFTEAQGLAVDQDTGDLLVIDAGNREPSEGTLSRFHEDGTPSDFSALSDNVIEGLSFRFSETGQVAVDNSGGATDGNIYVASQIELGGLGEGVVKIFDKDGNPLGQLSSYEAGPNAEGPATPFGNFICGVAVDPGGNVYVSELNSPGTIHKYEPTANPPVNADNSANFSLPRACNTAAGAGPTDGFIFASVLAKSSFPQGPAKLAKLDATTGAEAYEVDSGTALDPFTAISVDPTTGLLFAASGNEVREYDVSGPTEAIPRVPIAPGGGVVQGIAVDEDSGRIYVSRKGNPNIEVWGKAVELPAAITESASVIGDAVTMRGVVNANEGPETTCAFEYVEVSAEGFNGATVVPCSPAGPFIGKANETVSGEDSGLAEGTYRYRLVASNEDGSKAGQTLFFTILPQVGLPDGRAYEMVSPPQKVGEVIPPEPETQLGGSCSDCLPGVNDRSMPMQSNPSGSAVLYLGQPFSSGLASGPNEYLAPRSSSGWGIQSLSLPTTIGQFLAFSEDLSRGILAQANPPLSPQAPTRGGNAFRNLYLQESDTFEPLITSEPPNRDPGNFNINFAGANAGTALVPGFGHVAFEANDALTEPAPEVGVGKECSFPGANCNLYEWEDGELRLVNVLPNNGGAAAGAVIGAGRMLQLGIPQIQIPPNIDNAISEDGSRIFWSSEQTGQVYVRVEGKETLEIPGPGTCEEIVPAKDRACFLTATPDGSAMLLSDGTVYELNEAVNAYELAVDLTETKGGFEGILGTSEDLSRIYFVDTAVLTTESEENENGEHAEEDQLNLYAWEGGEPGFIGMLAPGDNEFGTRAFGAWAASPAARAAQVTPDGAHLAFMSLAPLTGYDNTLSGGGNCGGGQTPACREVFFYAADPGELSCASCNPSGEQPLGDSNLTLIRPQAPFRQPGNLSREGNGRLFFESQDVLSPRDVNGSTQDVYQWEPEGVGSCNREGGCVSLISSGQSPNDSMFMDSSESGDDAFFITREKLLPRDKNQQLDLYDARVGGGFEEVAPAPCSPESCAGPIASPPAQPSATSQEVSGPGNPKPKPKCKPGFVKKQGKCVKKKPKKKKAANNRGGSR
ncbi:MAG: hypothetical protein WBL45_12365 [Solirubrobacterales bacterium]